VRGYPLLQLLLIVVVFAAAGLPVWKLTRTPTEAERAAVSLANGAAAVTKDDASVTLEVETVFAPAPEDFRLRWLDRTVLEGRGPQARFSARWTAPLPKEGLDFVLQARWPASADASAANAARVVVRLPDGRQVEKSFWSEGSGALTEVFTVPGAAPSPSSTP
jgi:hypothetical protein